MLLYLAWLYNIGMKDLNRESSETITSSDLKQILSDHKKWLDSNGEEGAAANLKKRKLKGAVFVGANLKNANFEGAYLYGAYFKNANLEKSNLEGANLRGANLRWANLKNTNMKNTNLVRADLMQAELKETLLEGANLKMAEGLTSDQLKKAITNSETILPELLKKK
ncbi:MAG: pentapeptide repeat-containing protein [Nitrospinota bacterium]|nr:pentapeptide repeat-containing protein [Nitrospinota bacterium]